MFDRVTTLDRSLLDDAARVLQDIDETREDPGLRMGYRATRNANLRGYVGFSDRGDPITDQVAIDRLRAALHLGLRVLTDPRFQVRFVTHGRLEEAIDGGR